MEWKLERIGWLVMGVILLAGMLGLLGPGLLSHSQAGSTDSLVWAHYDRFARSQAKSQLHVYFSPAAVQDGKLHLWLSRDYANRVEIQRIEPEPLRVETTPQALLYVFQAIPGTDPTQVSFVLEPKAMGSIEGRLGVDATMPIRLSQFFFP